MNYDSLFLNHAFLLLVPGLCFCVDIITFRNVNLDSIFFPVSVFRAICILLNQCLLLCVCRLSSGVCKLHTGGI